jgi:hypothetical protein
MSVRVLLVEQILVSTSVELTSFTRAMWTGGKVPKGAGKLLQTRGQASTINNTILFLHS